MIKRQNGTVVEVVVVSVLITMFPRWLSATYLLLHTPEVRP